MVIELIPKLAFRGLSDDPDGDEATLDNPDLEDEDDEDEDEDLGAPDADDDVAPLEQ
jgi:hypothetical protein